MNTCGYCDLFMKCNCPREKKGQKPSINSFACDKYMPDESMLKIREENVALEKRAIIEQHKSNVETFKEFIALFR